MSHSHHNHDECHDECHSHDHHDSCCHGDKHSGSECEDFASSLLCVADQAWMEVLKCKIKQQIESQCGEDLDRLAKIIAESNHARWHHKIAKKKAKHEFREKLTEFFHHSSSCCKEGGKNKEAGKNNGGNPSNKNH